MSTSGLLEPWDGPMGVVHGDSVWHGVGGIKSDNSVMQSLSAAYTAYTHKQKF